jgi:hypothetical protein
MQKALLMFSSYNEDVESFRLSKISCYWLVAPSS